MPKKWNQNTINLLLNWTQQIGINEIEHRYRGTFYKRMAQFFNGISLLSQTGALTTMISLISSTTGESEVSRPYLVYITIISTVTYITDAITTFFDWAGLSEKHFTAAKEYKSLSLLIHATIPLSQKERGSAKNFLTSVRKQFNSIAENSPPLPVNKMIHQLDSEIFYENPKDARGKDIEKGMKEELKKSIIDEQDKKASTAYECRFRESLAEVAKTVGKIENEGGSTTNLKDYMQYQWRRMEED